MQHTCDIAIVGTGAAGSAAALAAVETDPDLDVLVVERATEGEHGGNTRYTDAYMRLDENGEPADGFVGDFETFSGGHVDTDIVRTLRDRATETIRWVEEYGVEFHATETAFLTSNRPRLLPKGGGLAILEALLDAATDRGVDVRYETTAESIALSDDGSVSGLRVRDATGEPGVVEADVVFIASGGFEGNPRMLTTYLEGPVEELEPMATGGTFNKGEGIEMALDAGGDTAGEFRKFHASVADPRSDAPGPSVHAFPYGIVVNKHGERFVDEGARTVDEHYEYVARRIRRQPDGIAYFIFDQKLHDVPGIEHTILSEKEPYEATPDYAGGADPLESTVRNLVEEIGDDIDAAKLLETVEAYNDSVQPGEFVATDLDGKRAETTPQKSNWARKLDTPPFGAYPLTCVNVFTFGGIATDTHSRVINADDRPIPGLYAAGEVTGLYYDKYTGATSVLRSLVFGRRGGAHAARWL